MPDPSVNEGHYDQLLTNMSLAFIQDANDFVADKVFPTVPVQNASDFYWVYPRGYFFRDDVGPRPMGGYSRTTGYKLTRQTYLCIEESIAALLDDRERANATPPYDPEKSKTLMLTQQQLIHRDKKWASKYFTSGVWTTDLTGVTATPSANQFLQWHLSTSSPLKDVKTRKRAVKQLTGFEPNVLLLGSDVEIALENHPDLVDRIKYTQRGTIDLDLLASLFAVKTCLVATSTNNTADEGQSDSYSFIFNTKSALLVYAAPEPGLDIPSGGYTFAWTGLLGNDAFAETISIFRGRDERAHSDWFEARVAWDPEVVSADLGVMFNSAVA